MFKFVGDFIEKIWAFMRRQKYVYDTRRFADVAIWLYAIHKVFTGFSQQNGSCCKWIYPAIVDLFGFAHVLYPRECFRGVQRNLLRGDSSCDAMRGERHPASWPYFRSYPCYSCISIRNSRFHIIRRPVCSEGNNANCVNFMQIIFTRMKII